MIKKCLNCGCTFGRQFEPGKCPFCKSEKVKIHEPQVNSKQKKHSS